MHMHQGISTFGLFIYTVLSSTVLLYFYFCNSVYCTGNSVTTQILGLCTPVYLKVKEMSIDSYLSRSEGKEKDTQMVLEVIVEVMCCVCACAGTSVIAGYSSLCVCVRVCVCADMCSFSLSG